MYKVNNKGPGMVPCGTPDTTGTQSALNAYTPVSSTSLDEELSTKNILNGIGSLDSWRSNKVFCQQVNLIFLQLSNYRYITL